MGCGASTGAAAHAAAFPTTAPTAAAALEPSQPLAAATAPAPAAPVTPPAANEGADHAQPPGLEPCRVSSHTGAQNIRAPPASGDTEAASVSVAKAPSQRVAGGSVSGSAVAADAVAGAEPAMHASDTSSCSSGAAGSGPLPQSNAEAGAHAGADAGGIGVEEARKPPSRPVSAEVGTQGGAAAQGDTAADDGAAAEGGEAGAAASHAPPPAPVSASASGPRPAAAADTAPAATADPAPPAAANPAAPAAAPPPEPGPEALATTRLGITLRGLRRLTERLRGVFPDFESMSTADVNAQWVEVVTLERRCRLVEMGEWVDPADVAPPAYFISHTWKNRCCRLLAHVLTYLQDAADTTAVWLDILCVNQHEDTTAHRFDVAPTAFSATVRACGGGTVVVLDREVVSPATRGWCIFEWAHTLAVHGADGLHLHMSAEDRRAVWDSIAVERSQCFKPSDKVMILQQVVEHYGSAAAFDAKLKLQLLLSPLSCAADVRRLRARAAALGSVWSLGPVRRWAADRGAGRMLVVAAGPGEGKSTISAALVSPPDSDTDTAKDSGSGSGSGSSSGSSSNSGSSSVVTAHHFLKHSDARTLEPLAVVKSLAFQLAERLPAVREALLALDVNKVDALRDPGAAFDLLLAGPLARAAAEGLGATESIVILLDALDEAEPQAAAAAAAAAGGGGGVSGGGGGGGGAAAAACPVACGNAVLTLLTAHLARLPDCVRFIVTTRPDAACGQVLPCLRRAFGSSSNDAGGGSAVTELAPAELCSTPSHASGGGGDGGEGSGEGGGGGGMKVYHTLVAAAAELGLAAAALPPLAAPPQVADVYRAYAAIFESSRSAAAARRQANHTSGDPGIAAAAAAAEGRVAELVAVAMAAREPLSAAFLQQLGLAAAVPALPGSPALFFLAEHRLHTLHKSLAEWLTDRSHSGAFAADVARGHRLIGLHLHRTWRQQQPQQAVAGTSGDAAAAVAAAAGGGHGGVAVSSSTSRYLLRYVVTHLAAAADAEPATGGPAEAEAAPPPPPGSAAAALDDLLGDFGFVRAVLAAGHGPAVIGALGGMARRTPYTYDMLRWLRSELGDLEGLDTQDLLVRALQAPPRTRLCAAALRATRQPWRTAAVLGTQGGGWPACAAVLQGLGGDATAVAFAPDGRQVAAVSGGKAPRVTVWDVETGRLNAAVAQPGEGKALAFVGDGRTLVAGCGDKVLLYDVATGQATAALHGPTKPVNCLALSPDGSTVAAGSDDAMICMWDLASSASAAAVASVAAAAAAVPAGGDGGGASRPAGVLAAAGGGHKLAVLALAFRADGERLASAGRDKVVKVWKKAAGGGGGGGGAPAGAWEVCATLAGHTSAVFGCAWSPGAHPGQLASCGEDMAVRLWDAESGACTATLTSHTGWVRAVAWAPDGRTLASVSDDKSVRLWATDGGGGGGGGGSCTAVLTGHSDWVRSACFAPDGRPLLASASRDQTVRLWATDGGGGSSSAAASNAASGGAAGTEQLTPQQRELMRGHSSYVRCVRLSADGHLIASCGDDAAVLLWRAAGGGGGGGGLLAGGAVVRVLLGHGDNVNAVAWRPAAAGAAAGKKQQQPSQELASASDDRTLRLWSAATGAATAMLEGHEAAVTSLAWFPDGRRLLSGSNDCTARVWDLGKKAEQGGGGGGGGACVMTLSGHGGFVTGVAVSGDGGTLVTGSFDNTLRLWCGRTGKHKATLQGHTEYVTCVAFCPLPGSALVASGSYDTTVRLWDTAAAAAVAGAKGGAGGSACVATCHGHARRITCVAFSADGRHVVSSGAGRALFVHEAPSGALVCPVHGHPDWLGVLGVGVNPAGPLAMIVSGGELGQLRVWEPAGR